MKDNERKIKIKVVAGYVILILFTFIAVWWVYVKIADIAAPKSLQQNAMYEKSLLTSSVISSIYNVDYYGRRLIQSYTISNSKKYGQALESLKLTVDSLRTKALSPHQRELIEKLSALISKNDKNTRELAFLQSSASKKNYIEQVIEKVVEQSSQEPAPEKIIVKSSVHHDTINETPAPKRKFFQRIGDVFSPPKTDPQKIKIVSTIKSDTLRLVDSPNDTLVAVLQKTGKDIEKQQFQSNRTISSKIQNLLSNEQEISNQMTLLVSELNRETTENMFAEIGSKQRALRHSGQAIAVVAVIAILIVAVFLFFILRDISRSGHYKRELETARARAEDLMQSRQRMLLNISHDIKAPLCSITGYLDLLESSSDSNARKWSGSMKLSSGYIMNLLTNLLEYARFESGKSVIRKSVFDFDAMMEDILKIFEPMADEKSLSLRNCSVSEVGYIESDAIRIRQIVMNLVSNAVKFTDKGGVDISYGPHKGDMLRISVKDSGCGIAKNRQAKIFEEFTRGESAEHQGVEGSGLGLSVVRGAARLLDGKIELESSEGTGSTFTVTIPVKYTEAEDSPQQNGRLSIMVVDDDKLQLEMTREMLIRGGHTVYTANTLEKALEIISEHETDVILSDLQMGAFSGHTLLQELRSRGCKTPVIAVSASDHTDTEELRKAGFDDFIRKPFSLHDLNKTVSSLPGGLDLTVLNEMMEGDSQAADRIVGIFIDSTVENASLLQTYAEKGDFASAQRLCHKMLPMFLQLGLNDIAVLLKEVDQGRIDTSKLTRIVELCNRLTNRYRTV